LFLNISSSWVKIRLHTENQLRRLPGSALKVPGGGWVVVASYPLLSQAPTHVEVELGCDKNASVNGEYNCVVCKSIFTDEQCLVKHVIHKMETYF
jgi:hypothetical protein